MNPENRRAKVSKFPPELRWLWLCVKAVLVFFGLGALLWLITGCAGGPAKTFNIQHSTLNTESPPIPPQHPHPSESILLGPFMPQASIMESTGDPVAVPSGSVTIRANPSLGATYYVLFAAPVPFLSAMQPAGTNATPEFTRATDQPMQFFQMKAGNEYGLSGWATK